MATIDGLVSGMDTSAIIRQLMQLERQPQLRLQQKRHATQRLIDAYQALNTRFAGVEGAADALNRATDWKVFTATSSKDSLATATASSSAQAGSITFSVEQLAKAHALASSNTVASTSDVVATGDFTITKGGITTTIAVGDGTLASVVDAVNKAGIGVSAAAVKVADGAYKLQLTASDTGSASAFTVDTTNLAALGTMGVVTQGQDATIKVGDGPGAYTITSATNTIADVMPGVTVNLHNASPGEQVTVTVASDVKALGDKVQKLIDGVNAALSYIKSNSGYDPNSKKAGLFLSDSTVRGLQSRLVQAVSDAVPGSLLSSISVGIKLNQDGTYTFDRAAFEAAYADDPAAVEAVFTERGRTTHSSVSFVGAGSQTKAGTYAVEVTAAASRATATGTATTLGTIVREETIDVRVGTTVVSYTAAAGATVDSIAAGLNSALQNAGLDVEATVVSGALQLQTSAYGTAATFDVRTSVTGAEQTNIASAAGVWETQAGTDVAGTIGGVAATGKGQLLTAPLDDPTLDGLTVRVDGGVTGSLGDVVYEPGIAQRALSLADAATDTVSGSIELAVGVKEESIRSLDAQIANWDVRLAKRELALRRQFAALETALGQARNQSNWLASQIAGLYAGA